MPPYPESSPPASWPARASATWPDWRRYRRRLSGLGKSENEQLHGAIGCDLDIRRLQIGMNDAALVCSLESRRDLPRDSDSFIEWRRTLQIRAFQPVPSPARPARCHIQSRYSDDLARPLNARQFRQALRRQPSLAVPLPGSRWAVATPTREGSWASREHTFDAGV